MAKMSDSTRMDKALLGEKNATMLAREADYWGHSGQGFEMRYTPLRADDTYFTERERALEPLIAADSIHNTSVVCWPSKMCHYGSGLMDGWKARVKWERDNAIGPGAHTEGYEASVAIVRQMVERERFALGSHDEARRRRGFDRLGHYTEILDALLEES